MIESRSGTESGSNIGVMRTVIARIACVILLLVASTPLGTAGSNQDDERPPLDVNRVAARGVRLEDFAPRGWKIAERVTGDLNRDNQMDAVLVLVEDMREKDDEGVPTERARALVIVLRDGEGWRRVGANARLLFCTRCGGAFWGVVETPVNVSVARDIINVEQTSGSRNIVSTIYRLRFDPKSNRVLLIGTEVEDRDRATGEEVKVSTNYLTGVRRTSMSRYSERQDRFVPTGSRTARAAARSRPLESLSSEDEY